MPRSTISKDGRHRLNNVAKQGVVPPGTFGQAEIQSASPYIELGQTGLLRYSGYVNEEFHRDLQGDIALRIYKEMSQNSATVGACLFAVEKLMRGTSYRVQAGGQSNEDLQAQELVETAINDMSLSWYDTLAEVLTMLPFGWSYHEIVYKKRQGKQRDPGTSSRYDDGLIGWRKLPIRSQDSRTRWKFDDEGGIQGMYQQPQTSPRELFIPIEKALLFRPSMHKNNPEGRSVLRTAYVAYYNVKTIQQIEAIGIERDLAGYPIGFVPAELLSSSRSSAQSTIFNALKKFLVNVRRDEQEGGLWPMAYDPASKQPIYDFKLLNSGGNRQFNTSEVIMRYNREIAMSMMADFLFLGASNVGSWALGAAKTSLFGAAVDSMLDQVDDVMNRHAIPRLLALNGFRLEKLPELKHSNVESVDLNTIAAMVTSLSGAGARLFPDVDLENHFRKLLGWPEMTEEAYREREDQEADAEQRRAEAEQELLRANAAAAGKQPMDSPPTDEMFEPTITKYAPDQPRHPAGHSEGGQWEAEGGGTESAGESEAVSPTKAKQLVSGLREVSTDAKSGKALLESGFREGDLKDYRALTQAATRRGVGELEELRGTGRRGSVRLADLTDTQGVVQRDALIRNLVEPRKQPILVARLGGRLFIVDGHHRAAAANLRGEKNITAEILELEG